MSDYDEVDSVLKTMVEFDNLKIGILNIYYLLTLTKNILVKYGISLL